MSWKFSTALELAQYHFCFSEWSETYRIGKKVENGGVDTNSANCHEIFLKSDERVQSSEVWNISKIKSPYSWFFTSKKFSTALELTSERSPFLQKLIIGRRAVTIVTFSLIALTKIVTQGNLMKAAIIKSNVARLVRIVVWEHKTVHVHSNNRREQL